MLPIAAAVTWVSLRKLANVGETQEGEIDWPSVGLAALGFGSLVYGLSRVGSQVEETVPPTAWIVVGAVLVVAPLRGAVVMLVSSCPALAAARLASPRRGC